MSSKSDANERFSAGMGLLRAGIHREAILEFTVAITLDSDFGEAYRARAAAFRNLGRRGDAGSDRLKADSILGPKSRNDKANENLSNGRGSYWRGFLVFGPLIVALSLLSLLIIVFDLYSSSIKSASAALTIWAGGPITVIVGLIFAAYYISAKKVSTALGILAGLGLGVTALGSTCYYALFIINI